MVGMRDYPTWMPGDRAVMEVEFEHHVRELAKRYGRRVDGRRTPFADRLWETLECHVGE